MADEWFQGALEVIAPSRSKKYEGAKPVPNQEEAVEEEQPPVPAYIREIQEYNARLARAAMQPAQDPLEALVRELNVHVPRLRQNWLDHAKSRGCKFTNFMVGSGSAFKHIPGLQLHHIVKAVKQCKDAQGFDAETGLTEGRPVPDDFVLNFIFTGKPGPPRVKYESKWGTEGWV